MLELALKDPLRPYILRLRKYFGRGSLSFDLAISRFVFTNFRRIGLTSMRLGPAIPRRGSEASRALMVLLRLLAITLGPRDEETTSDARLQMDTLILRPQLSLISLDFLHLFLQVSFLFRAHQQAELILVLVRLLPKIKLFFVSRRVAKAEVFGDG